MNSIDLDNNFKNKKITVDNNEELFTNSFDTNQYLLMHGLLSVEGIELTNALTDYMVELYCRMNNNYSTQPIKQYTYSELKNKAREYFKSMGYQLHNVGILSSKKFKKRTNGMIISSPEEFLHTYNSLGTDCSPFDIPTGIQATHSFNSDLDVYIPKVGIPNFDDVLLEYGNIYYNQIYLPYRFNDISCSSYIHEIAHTQTRKGSIEDLYNMELLSIFDELSYGHKDSLSLFCMLLAFRLNKTFETFTELYIKAKDNPSYTDNFSLEEHIHYSYISAFLKSLNLITTYIESNDLVKMEILNDINNIRGGMVTLEDILDKYEVSIESSIGNDKVLNLFNRFDKIKK